MKCAAVLRRGFQLKRTLFGDTRLGGTVVEKPLVHCGRVSEERGSTDDDDDDGRQTAMGECLYFIHLKLKSNTTNDETFSTRSVLAAVFSRLLPTFSQPPQTDDEERNVE